MKKAIFFMDAIESLTESRPTRLDKKTISIFFVEQFIKDLKESLEVAKELNPQAEGLIAGSIVIWTEIKKDLQKQ